MESPLFLTAFSWEPALHRRTQSRVIHRVRVIRVCRCHEQHPPFCRCTKSRGQVRFKFSEGSVRTVFELCYKEPYWSGCWQHRFSFRAEETSVTYLSLFLFIFIDVVLTQWPWYQQYKPSPQSMCIVLCLSGFFVSFSFLICRRHWVSWTAMCQESCLCPFSGTPGKRMKQRPWQENFSWLNFPLKPQGISQLSDRIRHIVLCQTGAVIQPSHSAKSLLTLQIVDLFCLMMDMKCLPFFFMGSEGQMQPLKYVNLVEEECLSDSLTFKVLPCHFQPLHRQCSHCQATSIYMITIPFKLS